MVRKSKKKTSVSLVLAYICLGLINLTLVIAYFIRGKNLAIINPKGAIAEQQFDLIIISALILFAIAIPTVAILYLTAWKYRETNSKVTHEPNAQYGKHLDLKMWLIPSLFIFSLVFIMWPATYRLTPRKIIQSKNDSLRIQVISLRWKWVFIYPEQNIATVNYVQIPVDTPVTFELTADEAPMSSFWIPNLGGQLYSMTSHVNQLNLIAESPGEYPGSSAEINGAGFAGMKFVTKASSKTDFDAWVKGVKQSEKTLDTEEYSALLRPSESHPVELYSWYDGGIYNKVISKYSGSMEGHGHTE
jgi:cytochrome o ubiquinol oxidase subunit 2